MRISVWSLGLGVAGLAAWLIPMPRPAPTGGERHFTVEASADAFRPARIRVARGDRVTIDLVATDVVHGLHVDGYGVAVTAEPGRPGRLSFVADREGTFRLRCSVTCGPLHPFIVGTLTVGEGRLVPASGAVWAVRR
jgi:heme/copper-type cytochrome/quinol oxidase subunit 2